MLTLPEVVPYLLRRKLISAASIVGGDLVVEDVSRRNCNFKVISQHGPSYVVKQGIDQEGIATVAHEAVVYQLLQADAEGDGLDRYLPHCYAYDPKEHVLILELVRDACDVRAYHARLGRFPALLAAATGEALGTLHHLTGPGGKRNAAGRDLLQPLPWVLSAHRLDLAVLAGISGANVELIRMLQHSPELRRMLDQLGHEWRADTLIHYDVKWDNCVFAARPAAPRKSRLRIVDWEFAGMGDPCWDAGSVFSNYLSFWLLSIPIIGAAPPDRWIELARYPLERMQPALRAYWQAYVGRMALDAATSDQWLLRAVSYGAARLIQTGFEHMQAALRPTGNIICLLQLSLNILRRPHEATVQLLGIPLQRPRLL